MSFIQQISTKPKHVGWNNENAYVAASELSAEPRDKKIHKVCILHVTLRQCQNITLTQTNFVFFFELNKLILKPSRSAKKKKEPDWVLVISRTTEYTKVTSRIKYSKKKLTDAFC